MIRFLAAQGVKVDPVVVEIHGGAQDAALPVGGGQPFVSQHVDEAFLVAAADEDDLAANGFVGIEVEVLGELASFGGGFAARGAGVEDGGDVASRALAQLFEAAVMKARPDTLLPPAIEAFDAVLKAVFARWREDGDDAQGQAQPRDASDGVGAVVGTLEDGVVVKVRVGRQPMGLPVLDQALDDVDGQDMVFKGPALGQAAEERDGVEHLDRGAVLDAQTLNDIKAVDLGEALGGDGQMPSAGRRLAACAAFAIKQAIARQDACDGAHTGQRLIAALPHHAVDGPRAALAQIAFVPQLATQGEHGLFGCRIGLPARAAAWPRLKVNAVQALLAGTLNPSLDGAQTDAKAPRGFALGDAAANGLDDAAPQRGRGFFSAMVESPFCRHERSGKGTQGCRGDKSLSFAHGRHVMEGKEKRRGCHGWPTPLSHHTPRLGARVALQQSPILRTAETSLADHNRNRQLDPQVTSNDWHLSDLF